MNAASSVWPLCPRPQADESLTSWFERVGYEYAMSPALLLGAVEQTTRTKRKVDQLLPASQLYESSVANRLTVLAKLSDAERVALWSPPSRWELHDLSFCTYCPYCCTADLAEGRSPYGRRVWQQAWCTVCKVHGTALTVRNLAHMPSNRSCWSHAALKVHREFLAANRYRDLKVRSQPAVRSTLLGCLVEIEQTTAAAIAGTAPNPFLWGPLTSTSFLTILDDVTTWALTHFEPVRCWSVAEDFTPTEEQEGYGLIGRGQRMLASDYRPGQDVRNLRNIANPKVRGAALWTAHALLATCHTAASDRASGVTPQERQAALFASAAAPSRHWLEQRQSQWPSEYRRARWIDVQNMA
jgi:TniQ